MALWVFVLIWISSKSLSLMERNSNTNAKPKDPNSPDAGLQVGFYFYLYNKIIIR